MNTQVVSNNDYSHKRVTDFNSNCQLENSPEASLIIRRAISSQFGNKVTITKVTDKPRQLQGIDFIVVTPEGKEINIDVKVRDAKSCERFWKGTQDCAVEWSQSEGTLGWGSNPGLSTDYVLFVWVGLENPTYTPYFFVDHQVLLEVTCPEFRQGVNRPACFRDNSGFNGHTYSRFLCIPLDWFRATSDYWNWVLEQRFLAL